MKTQHVTNGGIVWVNGHEFTASDVRSEVLADGMERVTFIGTCTDNPINDCIRHTGYNGGRYGGNNRRYTWAA